MNAALTRTAVCAAPSPSFRLSSSGRRTRRLQPASYLVESTRYAMRSARSCFFFRPAKTILVPALRNGERSKAT
jgi:hypothetical protein